MVGYSARSTPSRIVSVMFITAIIVPLLAGCGEKIQDPTSGAKPAPGTPVGLPANSPPEAKDVTQKGVAGGEAFGKVYADKMKAQAPQSGKK